MALPTPVKKAEPLARRDPVARPANRLPTPAVTRADVQAFGGSIVTAKRVPASASTNASTAVSPLARVSAAAGSARSVPAANIVPPTSPPTGPAVLEPSRAAQLLQDQASLNGAPPGTQERGAANVATAIDVAQGFAGLVGRGQQQTRGTLLPSEGDVTAYGDVMRNVGGASATPGYRGIVDGQQVQAGENIFTSDEFRVLGQGLTDRNADRSPAEREQLRTLMEANVQQALQNVAQTSTTASGPDGRTYEVIGAPPSQDEIRRADDLVARFRQQQSAGLSPDEAAAVGTTITMGYQRWRDPAYHDRVNGFQVIDTPDGSRAQVGADPARN